MTFQTALNAPPPHFVLMQPDAHEYWRIPWGRNIALLVLSCACQCPSFIRQDRALGTQCNHFGRYRLLAAL